MQYAANEGWFQIDEGSSKRKRKQQQWKNTMHAHTRWGVVHNKTHAYTPAEFNQLGYDPSHVQDEKENKKQNKNAWWTNGFWVKCMGGGASIYVQYNLRFE